MLDGGHLMRFAVELFAGRSFSEKVYTAIQPLGLLMLFGLMSLAFYNDILRIFN
jgi:regulator of sigma E protease